MSESFPVVAWGRWWPGARFLFRVVRRTLVESLYLLTAPVLAAAGLDQPRRGAGREPSRVRRRPEHN